MYDVRGRRLTARTHPGLLGFRAALAPDGEPTVDGRPWAAPEVAAAVGTAVGQPVRLGKDASLERFDVLPLLVVSDGIVRHLGLDRRRFRPNLFIEGVAGLAEREWEGRHLRIGEAVVALASRRGRCVMTTYDPDTLAQDHGVLRRIARELDGELGLDTAVVQPGRVTVGDRRGAALVEVTGDPVFGRHRAQGRALDRATVEGDRAARVEAAAGGRGGRRGHLARRAPACSASPGRTGRAAAISACV